MSYHETGIYLPWTVPVAVRIGIIFAGTGLMATGIISKKAKIFLVGAILFFVGLITPHA